MTFRGTEKWYRNYKIGTIKHTYVASQGNTKTDKEISKFKKDGLRRSKRKARDWMGRDE